MNGTRDLVVGYSASMLEYLRTIMASWLTPFSDEVWAQLEARKQGASKSGNFLALGYRAP